MKEGYYIQLGSPFGGKVLEELKAFLNEQGLSYAPNIQHTAIIRDDNDVIAATASLEDAVIKCVAARESARRGAYCIAYRGNAKYSHQKRA